MLKLRKFRCRNLLKLFSSCLFFLAFVGTQAIAANKYALLVGINNYQSIPPLQKAEGDARTMADVLEKIGFETQLVLNPTRRELNRAISAFRAKLQPGDTAFFHYSGHGIEINGRNYLLASDIPKPTTAAQDEIEGEAFAVASIINRVASTGAGARIFVLDACRDNPFATRGLRNLGSSRGLGRENASAGTFIFYSAGYGQAALDNLGQNDTADTSVYTRVLASHLTKPYAHIAQVARDVRRKVERMAKGVGHIQRPAYYDELSNDFCFVCDTAGNGGIEDDLVPTGVPIPPAVARTTPDAPDERAGVPQAVSDLVIRNVELTSTGRCKANRPVMNGRVEVENIGAGDAGSPQNPVTVSIRDTHPISQNWSNSTRLGVIPAGQKRVGYFPIMYLKQNPAHIHGLHEFEVSVDGKNKIREVNEENNTAYGEVELDCKKQSRIAANDNNRIINNRTAAVPKGGAQSFWDHNGSLMYLTSSGIKRAFFYKSPKRSLKDAGVRDGSLLFYGKKAGGNYIGKMRQFSKYCGTVEFDVRGLVSNDTHSIRVNVSGKAPLRRRSDCKITGYETQNFLFTYLYNASQRAQEQRPTNSVVKQVPFFDLKRRERREFIPQNNPREKYIRRQKNGMLPFENPLYKKHSRRHVGMRNN